MRTRTLAALAALPLLLACAGHPGPPGAPPPRSAATELGETRIAGYFAAWGPRTKGSSIAALPGHRLTHLIYAFARISEDGRVTLGDPCADVGRCGDGAQREGAPGGNFGELLELKRRHPHLRALIAVGGWSGSGRFSDAAATPEARRIFAESAVETFIRRWPGLFDGVDVDWEYPVRGGMPENRYRPEDRENLTLLLHELRRALDEQGARDGRRYLLTIATPAGPGARTSFDLEAIHPLLDWFNVMTYDYHTGGKRAHFNAPLFSAAADPTPHLNVDATVRMYRAAGVPPEKIVLGIPFYGHVYGGVPDVDHGLFQPAAGGESGEWKPGAIDYRRLMARAPQAQGFRAFRHAESQVPWLYNPETGFWVTYDDPVSVRAKAEYARRSGLGGVMVWELGGDTGELLEALHAGLREGGFGPVTTGLRGDPDVRFGFRSLPAGATARIEILRALRRADQVALRLRAEEVGETPEE